MRCKTGEDGKISVKLIHVSDIHFGSGESHGRLNPASGLNVRFEDFASALAKVVDFTLANSADVFLFSGDAYKTATPEPVYQQAFARQLKRLSEAGVSCFLLVGNHDQILRAGSSHAMSVFESLEVPGVTVIGRPELHRIDTKNGKIQLIGLPHVTRHLLMTQSKYADLSSHEIAKVLVKRVEEVLSGLYDELDPEIPAVLTAHMMADTARAGAEQELMVGYSMTFPLSLLIDPRLDYVALGHVHGHQILHPASPLIAYAGSLERVDFSEEKEDKGFLELDISRGQVSMRFHSINPRPFVTIELDLQEFEDPEKVLYQRVKEGVSPGAVMRVKYKIQSERLELIDEDALRAAFPELLSLRFKSELLRRERPRRMPELNENAILQPLDALKLYLEHYAPDKQEQLLERARQLLTRQEEPDDS